MKNKPFHNKQKGFVLIGMMFTMILMALSAAGLNRRSAMQTRMIANQNRSTQISLGQLSAIEDAAWRLSRTADWRTDPAGEDYDYNGIRYNRKVLDSGISGYSDVVTITVTSEHGTRPLSMSFRITPRIKKDLYIADTDNHRIRHIDETTGIITTVTGTGSQVDGGDSGPAVDASLDKPNSVSVDTQGNLYIADTNNHSIRKVDTAGIITTVAGNGAAGFSGDGGPATDAELKTPRDVYVDASGNIYIADTENNRIRKVDTSGIITTVAGNGASGFSGDGGPATDARLNKPNSVCMDADGNLYIADALNHRIRKVDTTGMISTVAGNGASGFSGDGGPAANAQLDKPKGVWVDEQGNIYIVDTENHRIRMVDSSGIINTVAGNGVSGYSGDGGPATEAALQKPLGIYVDASGNIYFADTLNSRIRMVDTAGVITTVAGTGASGYSGDGNLATNAQVKKPRDVWLGGVDPQGATLEKIAEMYWRTG
ncbi:MAG: hypothetical protein JRH18_02790 [Deltaproteobacteria bacterium]|nr:hypothetical protein [Deltaproteobacteria bacterium]MBW2150575.1 hypothetical protein [Deltaproteobacteria bacterium]